MFCVKKVFETGEEQQEAKAMYWLDYYSVH